MHGFNPRTREGATQFISTYAPDDVEVSIHAPVRVRPLSLLCVLRKESFNPRTREGATVYGHYKNSMTIGFNPRTREGATCSVSMFHGIKRVSIHAPVRVRHLFSLI